MEEEVESEDDVDVEGIAYASTQDFNVLIPQLSFLKFISEISFANIAMDNLVAERY
jgi:hypothetical protein